MVYCIGLTGTIASGKSTVADFFSTIGIDIISADNIAKSLTTQSQPASNKIIDHFGPSILTHTGDLDRPKLRQLIINQPQERRWLEQYLHPLIRKEIEVQIQNVSSPYCLIEIPLLKKKSDYPYLNRILLIEAHITQQIARCKKRDSSSTNDVKAILTTQKTHHPYLDLADDILKNTGTLDALNNKVFVLHRKYLEMASRL